MFVVAKNTGLGMAALAAALGVTLLGGPSAPVAQAQAPAGSSAGHISGTWTVDPVHTSVSFAIRHFGISQVRGRFDDVAGTIVAVEDEPQRSSVQFTIQAASIDTGFKLRDDDLRSSNFLDVAKFPLITFVSTSIQREKLDTFLATGNLTMHGVTHEIDLRFHVHGPIVDPMGGSRIGIETERHLDRTDYGVGGTQNLTNGDLAIGRNVDIAIDLEAVPAKPAG